MKRDLAKIAAVAVAVAAETVVADVGSKDAGVFSTLLFRIFCIPFWE